MVKLHKIDISNFRSFKGFHSIDLNSNELIVLRGKNLDTNGESAAGKSSLLLAFSFLLGICPYPNKELNNWFSDENFQLVLYFEWNDKSVMLSRGAKNFITIDGQEYTGARYIEEKLQTIFGLNPEQRYLAIYKEQGQSGYFLNKNNSEKKEFLTSILGFGQFEVLIDQIKQALDPLEKQYQENLTKIKWIKDDITDLETKPLPLEDIDELELKLDELSLQLEEKKQLVQYNESRIKIYNEDKQARLEIAYKSLNSIIQIGNHEVDSQLEAIKYENSKLQEVLSPLYLKSKKAAYNETVNAQNTLEQEIVRLKLQNEKLDKELYILNVNKCYTCSQPWVSENETKKLESQKSKNLEEIKANKANLANLVFIDIKKFEKEVEAARLRSLELKTEEQKLLKEKQDLFEALSKDIKKQIEDIKVEVNPLLNEQLEVKRLLMFVGSKKDETASAINYQRQLRASIKMFETKRATKLKEYQEIESENLDLLNKIIYLTNKLDFTKGFLNYIFSDILNEISSQTNSILISIPNVSNLAISLVPERTTQKGAVKQEIDTIVKINGIERPLRSGLSGGMQTALRLAVDLAVRRVIQQRTGISWGLLLVDEQFDGLDLICKAACMDIFRQFSQDSVVFVVDHHSEINESAQSTLLVQLENGESTCTYL